jgi:GTP cyclohydrolase IIa
MADIGLEEIRANNNEMWTWVIEKEYWGVSWLK